MRPRCGINFALWVELPIDFADRTAITVSRLAEQGLHPLGGYQDPSKEEKYDISKLSLQNFKMVRSSFVIIALHGSKVIVVVTEGIITEMEARELFNLYVHLNCVCVQF